MAQRQPLALVVGGARGRAPTTWLCNCSWGGLAPSLGPPPLCAVKGWGSGEGSKMPGGQGVSTGPQSLQGGEGRRQHGQ